MLRILEALIKPNTLPISKSLKPINYSYYLDYKALNQANPLSPKSKQEVTEPMIS